jgi:hypothetical protein
LLEEPPSADGESALPPGRQQTTRDQGEQEQCPGQEASGIEAPLQSPAADDPPGKQPQEVLYGMHADEGEEALQQVPTACLTPEARVTGETQAPAARDPGGTELLTQDGGLGSAPAPWRHTSRIEHMVDFYQQWCFDVPAQYRADDRWLHLMYFAVRPQDGHLPPTTEQGEEVWLARTRDAEEGWTSTAHEPLDLGIRYHDRFDVQTEAASC